MARTKHFFIQTFRNPAFDLTWDKEPGWHPQADIYQTEEQTLIYIEVAGVPEDQLKLHVEERQLIIEGERQPPVLPHPQHCQQAEIAYGPFRRVLPLPADADESAIQAHYQAGILQIIVPRKDRSSKSIQVNIR